MRAMQISTYDVVILGAGAAGLLCAAEAGKRGRRVLLLDKAEKIGKKILISGGGRCNFTNIHTHPNAYLSHNPHFCKSALARYTPSDFMALMRKHRLSWHEKTLGQLFCDQKAPAVVEMLWQECQAADVELMLNVELQQLERRAEWFYLQTTQAAFQCHSLVMATGGPSIPRMGSSDFALQVAKKFGVKNIPFSPALVPLTFEQATLEQTFAGLQGVSTEVIASCGAGQFREQILFTHRGLSGPALLQISSYWQKGAAITLDLLPGRMAEEWLTSLQKQRPKAELKTVLADVLPQRLAQRLCELYWSNRPLGQYSAKQLVSIAQQLQAWQLYPAGTEGMRTAEVALGGIDTTELSSKTMAVTKVPGLYFIGEAVDVTGWLGGYNFQWAWASGWCAGQAV